MKKSFSLNEGLERVYEGKPTTEVEKLIGRLREYCRSCKNYQELITCLELTDSEIAIIESMVNSSLDRDDVVLIMTGYTPDVTGDLVNDSQELKRVLNMKPEKVPKEIRKEFYKLKVKYLTLALDETIVMARQFGKV